MNKDSKDSVRCECGHLIFNAEQGVIRSRCVFILEGTALCRCKKRVPIPALKAA